MPESAASYWSGPPSGPHGVVWGVFAPNAPNLIDPSVLGVGGEETVAALGGLDLEHRIRPDAIVVASPHWQSPGRFLVDTTPRPRFIEDFSGFPPAMYGHRYAPPGDPDLARALVRAGSEAGLPVEASSAWGLDHGAWSALSRMAPSATIPVVPLSSYPGDPAAHARWGQVVAEASESSGKAVAFVGTGQILHNFSKFSFGPAAERWPEGETIEGEILARMLRPDWESVAGYDPVRWRLADPEGGLAPYFALAGAVGQRLRPHLVANERCFGSAGMSVIEFRPR